MTEVSSNVDVSTALHQVQQAVADSKLTASAAENLTKWLSESRYENYRDEILQSIDAGDWQTLDDVFWTVIPFGTGGRRGRMHPFGSNAINHRTIGESAQGLADYVKSVHPDGPWSCAIGYDTRHRSREFAELCAGILVSNGFHVFFIDDYRSTPELSYLIRYKNCSCGIMVTASHNPPSDNAVKVYWSNGAQLIPPHDKNVIECVGKVDAFEVADFQTAVDSGKIILCREEIDAALLAEHQKQSFGGPRDIKVIYSPLHGVGEFNVKNLFDAVGLTGLEIYEPNREPNGDFPNVPGHVSNPENPEVFEKIIERAKQTGAELILATDPDCDRMGAAAPLTLEQGSEWKTLNGNQLGVLLADYILKKRKERGDLTSDNFIVTTLVTTRMIRRIAESYGIRCDDNNLVGFKWICSRMEELGADKFVFGTEESHGYLVGEYCRDKDGAVACLLMTEVAADARANGMSVHEYLAKLHQEHGFHAERLLTIRMEGSDGMKRMQQMMNQLRESTPWNLGEFNITFMRDFQSGKQTQPDGSAEPFDGPEGNLIILDTDIAGNYVAIRPSGTEPKIKLYLFGYEPAAEIHDLTDAKSEVHTRLDAFEKELRAFADQVK